MLMTQTIKTKPAFEKIKSDMLDRLALEAEKLATQPAPKPTPVLKRWPRLLVW